MKRWTVDPIGGPTADLPVPVVSNRRARWLRGLLVPTGRALTTERAAARTVARQLTHSRP